MKWRDRAACGQEGMNPELWFADDPASIMTAKRVCFSCPVRMRCHTEGKEELRRSVEPLEMGIWGGLTAREFVGMPTRTPRKLQRDKALTLLVLGHKPRDVARMVGVTGETVREWYTTALKPVHSLDLSEEAVPA